MKAQWLILQGDESDGYVIATGEQHSVREFCEKEFGALGIRLEWKGTGGDERGIVAEVQRSPVLEQYAGMLPSETPSRGTTLVSVDPRYFRPTEVETLLGGPSKAHRKLAWVAQVTFDEMILEMIASDLEQAARDAVCRRNDFTSPASMEAVM